MSAQHTEDANRPEAVRRSGTQQPAPRRPYSANGSCFARLSGAARLRDTSSNPSFVRTPSRLPRSPSGVLQSLGKQIFASRTDESLSHDWLRLVSCYAETKPRSGVRTPR